MSTGPVTLDVRGTPPSDLAFEATVDHLRAGGLLAYPTETVYGFGGLCTPESVAALAALKPRGAEKPFLVLAPSFDAVADLEWSDEARELAEIFWPGAVTLVLPDPQGRFPAGVRSSTGTVAVRVSPHPVVVALMNELGEPITSTSANPPGVPPARSGDEALEAARILGAGDEVLVVDAGTLPESGPSTLVDCTGGAVKVLREGTVPVGRLRCAIPHVEAPPRG